MAFNNFTLQDIEERFGFAIRERDGMFAGAADVEPSEPLRSMLKVYIPLALAINTEKSRSELMIAPILVEVRERSGHRISLFSGTELSADPDRGLNGYCDFILSGSPQQQFLRAPLVTVVEAKNDNPKSGFGQCLASMIGARVFNEKHGEPAGRVYGVITTGSLWRFAVLDGNEVTIETREYHIDRVSRILGVLMTMVGVTPSPAPLPPLAQAGCDNGS